MNETGMKVRTRFAPSPTGFQHVGGMRTAMYAWLFARKHGGQVLLRVEDTDQERKVPGALRFLIEELAWLGIKFDEGPSDAELKEFGEEIPGGGGMKEWPCNVYSSHFCGRLSSQKVIFKTSHNSCNYRIIQPISRTSEGGHKGTSPCRKTTQQFLSITCVRATHNRGRDESCGFHKKWSRHNS